ncbi:MAG: carbohydrate binding family 9 domain-containing protein, partial [Acidobacteriota bacterium]|nr:carbohydrate binding family 9 domain-containing protein [Acidobacteriota bacterium]
MFCIASASSTAAQTKPGSANVATAVRVTEAPTLDGDVLGDPAWNAATPITGFVQEQPNEGQPASEKTEVRIIYTADTLYVGVVLYDSDPSGIIVSDARRDSPLDDTDSFRMIIDTYRDRQNGFVFGTNPTGLEYDGQVTNEGQGGGGLGLGQ